MQKGNHNFGYSRSIRERWSLITKVLHLPTSQCGLFPKRLLLLDVFFTLSATPTSYFVGPENTCRIKNCSDISNSLKNINKLIETGSKKTASLNHFITASSTQRKTIILVKRPSWDPANIKCILFVNYCSKAVLLRHLICEGNSTSP